MGTFNKKGKKIPIVGPEIPDFEPTEDELDEAAEEERAEQEARLAKVAAKGNGKNKSGKQKPVEAVLRATKDGNGRREPEDIENTIELEPNVQESSAETYEETDDKDNIPGKGFMFAVKERHLAEATRLNDREITSMAINYTQDAVLDPGRKESVFSIFASKLMHLKISKEGLGRDDFVTMAQLNAEEKAESKGDLFVKP